MVQSSLLTSPSSLPDWNPSSTEPVESVLKRHFSECERDIPVGSMQRRLLGALWTRGNGGESMVELWCRLECLYYSQIVEEERVDKEKAAMQ